MNMIYRRIIKKIRKYDTIVIARHIGPDPDALGSQLGLKELIINTYPKKKVYAVGTPASKFKYLGLMDKMSEELYKNSLLIVTDTPNYSRIDGVDATKFECVIKIDHHPFMEQFGEIELVDVSASSASQLIIELAFKTRMKFNDLAALQLYTGLVADTERFLYPCTQPHTFELVSKLINKTNLDITNAYEQLYKKPFKEVKFNGYIADNMKLTENGLAYIYLTDDVLKKYDIDASTARNMVSNYNYIDGMLSWVILTYDKSIDMIRGSIRSRGPIINEVATHFNGGGHQFASGCRVSSEEEIEKLIQELDEVCKNYKNS